MIVGRVTGNVVSSNKVEKLRNANLTYIGSERIASVYDVGTVISQSVIAFAEVEELTGITLTVSSGDGGIFS